MLFAYSNSEKRYFSQEIIEANGKIQLQEYVVESSHWGGDYDRFVTAKAGESYYLIGQSDNNNFFSRKIHKDGSIASHKSYDKKFKDHYANLCTYMTSHGSFICMQNNDDNFYIRKVLPDGSLSEPTFKQKWKNYYANLGCFEIDGKHFLYGQKEGTWPLSSNRFFIQELSNEGTSLGTTTYTSNFAKYYHTMGAIKVAGDTYLYGQSTSDKKFFIQQLSSKGTLTGSETTTKNFGNFYDSMGSLSLNNKSYLYGISKKDKKFFITAVYNGGVLAKDETYVTHFMHPYNCMVSITDDAYFNFDNSYWMDTIDKHLSTQRPLTLQDYCLPAAHDAAMYKLQPNLVTEIGVLSIPIKVALSDLLRKSLLQVAKSFALTQDKTILQQLTSGVRYFDVRPGFFSGVKYVPGMKDELHVLHTLPGPTFATVIKNTL